jgi:LmbE family N-acetylglucosaminyl deacetylase
MGAPRLLGVFAHPDDEVFCAGGTLAKYVASGAEAVVLSATRGEAGQIRDSAKATRATLAAVREQELRDACAVLGVQRVEFLDHVDSTLADVGREALAAEIATVLDEVVPDIVITFGPDGAYGHPDHMTIGDATTDAFVAQPRGRLYHSHFARSRLLLVDRLAHWLVELEERFHGPADFGRAFSLFTQETATLGYAADQIDLGWFPPGEYIVEQGEPATSLYLILSGQVDIAQDQPDGTRVPLRREGPGEFFGELGLAGKTRRTAHVIAVDSVTCLVFSRRASTGYDARGVATANVALPSPEISGDGQGPGIPAGATTVIDVRDFVDRKIGAIAAHRTQYPIEPEMFPPWMLREMMGHEYFVRVHPPPDVETDLGGSP